MVEKELEDYIKTQRSLGVNDHAIRKSLIEAGYTDEEFSSTLAKHAKSRQSAVSAVSAVSAASAELSGGSRFTPEVKHVLWLNLVIVVAFVGIIFYMSYDYNMKLANLSAEQKGGLLDVEQKVAVQGQELQSQIISVENSLSGEIDKTAARVDSVSTDLDLKIRDYTYQSIQRDSQLSSSIQTSNNRSLTELSSFSQELENFRKTTVDFSKVIPKAVDSVVTIGKKGAGYFTTSGSGVLINNNGYIVTNYHVIDEISMITVKTSDDQEYTAKVIGKDEEWDLAVLKLTTERNNFEYLEWADSAKAAVGDHVIAIGNPVGFDSTVTQGIISNTKRLISGDIDKYYLQTDVAINAGNSGGPLIDKDGKIVGIATLKYTRAGYEGLSFALRSNDIKGKILEILQKEEK